MKVLVTGATGYLGRAVAQRLLTAGHTVTGLVRDDLGRRTLARSGIDPVLGDLGDPSSLRAAAEAVDAVVETASADNAASVVSLLEIIAGTGKRLIRTSGTGIYTDMAGGEPSATVHTEDDGYTPIPEVGSRYHSDLLTQAAADAGDHTVVMRPSMVYGYGGSEQLPVLLRAALRDGVSRYTGRGLNRYGNVYLDDVAEAYLLALERAPAGSAYNLAADESEMRQIAADVGRLLGLDGAVSISMEEAVKAFGPRSAVSMASNSRVDSTKARTELGWSAEGPSLVDDLTRGSYRRVWAFREPSVVAATSTGW
jgi:nucleoside-diphosphate-sugar epimerase